MFIYSYKLVHAKKCKKVGQYVAYFLFDAPQPLEQEMWIFSVSFLHL